jgi:hypothetical protein
LIRFRLRPIRFSFSNPIPTQHAAPEAVWGDLDINNPVADDCEQLSEGKRMADVEWQPLPALWPAPAVWTDVGELMLLVFTQDGVPTWEVNRRAKAGRSRDDLIASGTADTFEAAKAAALFEARAQSSK